MRPLTGLRESSNPITNWPRYLSFEILTQKMEMFCIFESSLHIPYPLKISSSFEKYCNLKFIRASSSKRVYENSLRYFCEACSGLQVWSSTAANAHVGLEVVRVVLRIFTSLWWRGAVCTHICKRRVEGRGLTISQKKSHTKHLNYSQRLPEIFFEDFNGLNQMKAQVKLLLSDMMATLTLYELILFQNRWHMRGQS